MLGGQSTGRVSARMAAREERLRGTEGDADVTRAGPVAIGAQTAVHLACARPAPDVLRALVAPPLAPPVVAAVWRVLGRPDARGVPPLGALCAQPAPAPLRALCRTLPGSSGAQPAVQRVGKIRTGEWVDRSIRSSS